MKFLNRGPHIFGAVFREEAWVKEAMVASLQLATCSEFQEFWLSSEELNGDRLSLVELRIVW